MTAPRLRPATPDDLDPIVDLHIRVWRDTYRDLVPPEAFAALNHTRRRPAWEAALAPGEPRRGTLVAEQDGALLGLVSYGPPRHEIFGTSGEIKHLYVDLAHRRWGHGETLLRAGLDALEKAGFPSVALAVVAGNVSALAFYQKLGGVVGGWFFDPGPLWQSENLLLRWEALAAGESEG